MAIKILDCTLRDGGYINNWLFRKNHIYSIVNHLNSAKIDFIECGYLNYEIEKDDDLTIFKDINQFHSLVVSEKSEKDSNFLMMINYGEYPIDKIPVNNGQILGIRVAFHKKDWKEALLYCKQLINKKYAVFVQPMITINYTDEELLKLIYEVNTINPYAMYIVDSFGVMKQKDLLRMTYLLDNNLNSSITLGYHAHNNLQLAFSNAQVFCETKLHRDIIIDSSVYGMGRGAGNLNTELFVKYLNENFSKSYIETPLLKIIDESLSAIYQEHYWGYSLPYFISAKYNCHPKYASYLVSKNSLTIESIEQVISKIAFDKKDSFDQMYIETLYIEFQSIYGNIYRNNINEIFINKHVLIVGPGKSLSELFNRDKIKDYINKNNPIVVSLNFYPEWLEVDYTFISNKKRFSSMKNIINKNLIITSNIEYSNAQYCINYKSVLYDDINLHDNSLIMLLKLLINSKASHVILAGVDGYNVEITQNYIDLDHLIPMSKENVNILNSKISKALIQLSKNIAIDFITQSKYVSDKPLL